MAYVPPNSIIKLLADVPIDSSFDHTLWFESANAQYNYFNSKAVRTFTNVSYTRKGRGYIKVEAPADQLYACNYMMFQNTSYSNKWFYAFCQVEYVNDTTSAVYFKLDQLQTWFFEMQLGQCFVEREHSTTDNIGDNLVPENLETGEYIITNEYIPEVFTNASMEIVIAATWYYDPATQQFTDWSGQLWGGIYQGLCYNHFPADQTGIAAVNQMLLRCANTTYADGIVQMFMCPSFFFNSQSLDAYEPPVYTFTSIAKPTTFDGYVPKNNKLFTAPYMSMFVKTPTNMAEFGYEYFENPAVPQFKMTCAVTTSPSILLEPKNYKTEKVYIGQKIEDNFCEGITLENYPTCAYNIDTYKAWLAHNGASLIVNGALAVGGLIGTLVQGISIATTPGSPGAPVFDSVSGEYWMSGQQSPTSELSFSPSGSGLLASLGAIGNIVAQIYQHYILPNQAVGATNADSQFVGGRQCFIFANKMIRPEFAKIIDQYFDRFGYACHQIKVPNIHARTRWTYTKTIGCQVHGNLPADAIKAIQSIFDRGITFWADTTNFGNYSLNNDIIVTP